MIPAFDHFIAVDWSGAKGLRHRNIAVALCGADGPPAIISPPAKGGWARTEVADWLAAQKGSLLAGFDFSFAPPFIARGCYLPGVATPADGPGFWAWLDAQCDDPDLGAASFLEVTQRRHFYFGKADGKKADYMHFRMCELAFNANGGGKPSTVFDAIGAAQVAKASFAGMRLLHHLHPHFAVWPFDPRAPRTIIEIYARAMIRHAGLSGRKIRDAATLATALAQLGSPPPYAPPKDDNESDALVTAAALRHLASQPELWQPPGLTAEIACSEGWTFGVI